MTNQKKHKKMSKTKRKRLTKKWIKFGVIFLLVEIALISFLVYFFHDRQNATDSDVYKIKTKIIQTETFSGNLYLTTTNGNFVTHSQYLEGGKQYCRELSSLLLEDPEVELTVLKNSDSFCVYFMDDASTVVGIESEKEVYSTVEQYNDHCYFERIALILSFIIFEAGAILVAVFMIRSIPLLA